MSRGQHRRNTHEIAGELARASEPKGLVLWLVASTREERGRREIGIAGLGERADGAPQAEDAARRDLRAVAQPAHLGRGEREIKREGEEGEGEGEGEG